MLEEHGVAIAVVSAVVLVQQGMSAWMQLDDSLDVQAHTRGHSVQCRASLPGPEHSELLMALTGLVFNLCKQKESA
jgi:hypothetical protein